MAEDDSPDVLIAEAPEVIEAPEIIEAPKDNVTVTVINEEAPDEPAMPEAHSHEELAHCEHCEEHSTRLAALEEFAAGITAEIQEVEEEAVEQEAVEEEVAPAEEPPADEDVVEDEPPKRVHPLHRKLFG